MKPVGTPRDAIRPNGFFLEAIVNSAIGSKSPSSCRRVGLRLARRFRINRKALNLASHVPAYFGNLEGPECVDLIEGMRKRIEPEAPAKRQAGSTHKKHWKAL